MLSVKNRPLVKVLFVPDVRVTREVDIHVVGHPDFDPGRGAVP